MVRDPDTALRVSAGTLAEWGLVPLLRVCKNTDEFGERLRRFVCGNGSPLPSRLDDFVQEVDVETSLARELGTRVRVELIGDDALLAVGDPLTEQEMAEIHSRVQELLPGRGIIQTRFSSSRH